MVRRLGIVAVLIFTATLAASAEKKVRAPLMKLPTATVELNSLEISHPKQPCPNWAWAAGLEMMLHRQNVERLQSEWVLKAYGGEVCIESAPVLEDLKRVVDGIYHQPDGSKVRIDAVITSGAPTDVGYLIGSLRDQRPLLILYAGRVLVLQALEYDEYIFPNSQRMFEARKLTMLDPISGQPEVFEKAKDDISKIGGLFEVRVEPAATNAQ